MVISGGGGGKEGKRNNNNVLLLNYIYPRRKGAYEPCEKEEEKGRG